MPNYYLSVLYKHIIQVENKNVGLKVGGHKHTIAPPVKKVGGHMPPLPPPLPTPVYYMIKQVIAVITSYRYVITGYRYIIAILVHVIAML